MTHYKALCGETDLGEIMDLPSDYVDGCGGGGDDNDDDDHRLLSQPSLSHYSV